MASLDHLLEEAVRQLALVRPMLGTYVHVLLSALFAIYTGSHASLTRPSSAAKPAKKKKAQGEDDEEDSTETLQKMEGLSPTDAIMFPILAGSTLAGLYFIIKWLEDPAILNTILNWYFAVFGVLGVAKLFTDAMGLFHSIIFPSKYTCRGQSWEIKSKQRTAISTEDPSEKCSSPLPGGLSKIELSPKVTSALWVLRELPMKRIHVRAYIYRMLEASVHIGPHGCLSFLLALAATLYFNLVAKPWWLTNILGYSFAYASLQLMSPTTFSTGSLILAALFVYDIYFVFYTPLMVTVATKLDIPAKMLFPRPQSPKDDPTKQSLAMLGLGDIVLPGLVIGFALRFDLYLFYLRKQKRRTQVAGKDKGNSAPDANDDKEDIKAEYKSATGGWGERLWVSKSTAGEPINGGVFPKTYFYACIRGYILGMVTTLGVMSISGSAQPALLYLVPGVLVSLWASALYNGDLKAMWNYDETEEEDTAEGKHDEVKKGLMSIFSRSRQDEKGSSEKRDAAAGDKIKSEAKEGEETAEKSSKRKGGFFRDRKSELVFFSVNLPGSSSSEPEPHPQNPTPDQKPKSKMSVEEELRLAFEADMADTPPATRTRSMRKSIIRGDGEMTERRPEKRLKSSS